MTTQSLWVVGGAPLMEVTLSLSVPLAIMIILLICARPIYNAVNKSHPTERFLPYSYPTYLFVS